MLITSGDTYGVVIEGLYKGVYIPQCVAGAPDHTRGIPLMYGF